MRFCMFRPVAGVGGVGQIEYWMTPFAGLIISCLNCSVLLTEETLFVQQQMKRFNLHKNQPGDFQKRKSAGGALGYAVFMIFSLGIPFPVQSRADVYIQCAKYPVFNGKSYLFTVTDTNALDGTGSFDWIMRNAVGPNTNVFIGPGIFATRGVWNGSWGRGDDATGPKQNKGFRVQDGCKITGTFNGTMPRTTLRLMGVLAKENTIMCPPTDFKKTYENVAITNLILDCNGPTLTTNWAYPKYLAAMRLLG